MQNRGKNHRTNANDFKASFDRIYAEPDPREYYRVLYGLDYIIPDLARDIFRNCIAALERSRGRRVKVLDLGCSYGNNAALVRLPLDLSRLAQRYSDMQIAGMDTQELIRLDRHYFQSWPRLDVEIVGFDASRPAIDYARAVGLIDDGFSANLEIDELPLKGRRMLQGVDLIISTGAIGYVTERTINRLLDGIGEPAPWMASFVLRMFPFDTINTGLASRGYTSEKLTGVTFVQRRFHSESECRQALEALERQGIDTTGKETEGLLHAELFVSRPMSETSDAPLESLASVSSGVNRPFGRRFRRGSDSIIRLAR